jgi:N6-L-threonylcarbamoyladenine synthase
MRILGIETSCDETAAAVVERDRDGTGRILSNVVLSQLVEHSAYGGVVPEIAARAHVEALDVLIARALDEAGVELSGLDGIAATAGPGLIGGLLVGLMTGKAIAMAAELPLVAVNHLEAHALTARLTDKLDFPYLLLLVTGGHTQIVAVSGVGRYVRYGTTVDDAVGEAFDKAAKMLGLGWPGGPAVEGAASKGDATRIALPRPMVGRPGCDFSFSGLKTALRIEAERMAPLSDTDIADLCAAFQAAVVDCLTDRTRNALGRFVSATGAARPVLVVAGGVAANAAIRAALEDVAKACNAHLVAPPLPLCGDNAAMVAWAGAERLALGLVDSLDAAARARWPLEETCPA